jgi:predicted NBD/HSP70 family sugar kinase
LGDILVFDVGGTLLRAAVYDGDAAALSEVRSIASPSFAKHPDLAWSDLVHELVVAMSDLRSSVDPLGRAATAAISFPGPVDTERRVLAAPPLWGSLGKYPMNLEAELEGVWPGVTVRVMNDVTAAGYRYLRDAHDEFCIATVSTGIGNKVFVAGRPLLGPGGGGGEIGHLRVDLHPDAPPCDCGGRGHLGAVASGRGLSAAARSLAQRDPAAFARSSLSASAQKLTAEAIAVAYQQGDPWATERVAVASKALGGAFAGIHLAIGVERFVLIGGFALGLGPRFAADVLAAIHGHCWRGDAPAGSPVTVTLGESDGRCALVGAGRGAHLGLLG